MIVAAPPMHADYITSATGTAPDVFNLSVVPDGYYSKYEVDNSSSTSSTEHQHHELVVRRERDYRRLGRHRR